MAGSKVRLREQGHAAGAAATRTVFIVTPVAHGPQDEQLEFRAVFAGGPTAGQLQDEMSVGVAIVAWGGPNVGGACGTRRAAAALASRMSWPLPQRGHTLMRFRWRHQQ